MPIQTPASSSTFQNNILAALVATGITQTSPGGKARAFGDAVGDQLGGLEGRSFSSIGQALLPYATKDNLDFLGEIYGLPRLGASAGSSNAEDGNFAFYVKSGTFGSINNGQVIVVPAGTVITTNSSGGPVYTLDSSVTLPANQSLQYFSATSTANGGSGNATSGIFTNSNFRGYADANFGTLLVTNNFGIISGTDAELDDNYRYRISLKLQSTGGAAEADLRLAILQVPGIQDIVFERQAGTYTTYVYGISPAVPPSLLQMVQAQIDATTAWPLTGTAVGPDLVGISFATAITFVNGASTAQQSTALANATAAASNYINNLAVGQEFVINELAATVLNSDPNILDIGTPNQPLSSIYIWRSRDDGSRYSRFLVADYAPQTGERIIVESSISNPIVLTPAS